MRVHGPDPFHDFLSNIVEALASLVKTAFERTNGHIQKASGFFKAIAFEVKEEHGFPQGLGKVPNSFVDQGDQLPLLQIGTRHRGLRIRQSLQLNFFFP